MVDQEKRTQPAMNTVTTFSQPSKRNRPQGTLLLAACLLAACVPAAVGQEAKPPADPADVKQVYVPIDALDAIIERDRRGVTMPREEFLKLLEKAREHSENGPPAFRGMEISRAEYHARTAGDQLIVTARLELDQYAAGWRALPLPFRGMGVERAQWGDKPARLGRSGNPAVLMLLNDQPGRRTLELELSAPLVAVGSDKVAAFGLPRSPTGTLKIALPASLHLLVDELAIGKSGETADPVEHEIAIGGRDELRLRITEHETRQTSEGMVFASTAYAVGVSPGEVDWRADTNVEVFGKPLDRLVFRVPRTLEIVDVDSSGLESWELADDAGDATKTVISLAYRQPFRDSRQVTLRGVTPAPAGTRWSVPPLLLTGAMSHVGRLVVAHPADVRLRNVSAAGVRPVAGDEAAAAFRGFRLRSGEAPSAASRMVFDAWREGFELEFVTEPKRPEIYADILTSLEVPTTGLQLNVAAKIETVYAPLFELGLSLPAEWTIASVTLDGNAARWHSVPREAGQHAVTIALNAPLPPGKELSLVLSARRDLETWPINEQGVELTLPEVRIPDAAVVVGSYLIKADPDLEVAPLEISGLDPAHLQIPGERLGYRYQDTRFSGRLKLARRPARLSVETLSFTRLDQDALRTHLEINLDAGGGGLREVSISLPEATGADVRFVVPDDSVRILEQRSAAPANGERLWTLRFDRLIKGRQTVEVDLQLPRGEQAEYQPPAARVTTADRQNGYLIVEGETDQRLTIAAFGPDNQPLTEVDPVDLPQGNYRPRHRVVAAYRYTVPGHRLALSEERFDRLGVPTAICRRCDMKSVLGRTGEVQHHAVFELAAVGVQSLKFSLPEEAELWSTLVDGAPVEARRVAGGVVVPLTSASRSDGQHKLTLVYLTQSAPLHALGRIQQQLPRLSVIAGGGQEQALEVLERSWTVSYPRGTSLLQSDGRFHPDEPLDRTSLLGRFGQSFSIPTTRDFLGGLVWLAGASGLVYLFVRSFQRRRFLGLGVAAVATVLCVGAVLFALLLPAGRSAREAAEHAAQVKSAAPPTGSRGVSLPAAEMPAPPMAAEPFADFSESEAAPPADAKSDEGAAVQALPQVNRIPRFKEESGKPVAGLMGRLSVAVPFRIPDEHARTTFSDRGGPIVDDEPELDVLYEDRSAGAAYRLALAAAAVCLMWSMRRTPRRVRVLAACVGLIAPLALIPITPVSWHIWLDGIFLGVLAGLALWIAAACIGTVRAWCASWRLPRVAQSTGALLLALAALHSSGSSLFAQQETSPAPNAAPRANQAQPPRRPAANEAVAQPIASNVAAAADSAAPDLDATRSTQVIVPYDPDNPLAAPQVYLPYRTFLRLWNQAYPEKQIGGPAPVEGAVAGSIYAAELRAPSDDGKASVSITARLVVCNYRNHQITLPLPLGKVAVRSAKLNGENAPLLAAGEATKQAAAQPLRIVLDQPGTHLLDLEFDVPAEVMGPAGRFNLPLSPVAAGRLSFVLPGPNLTARVNGTTAAFRQTKSNDRDMIELPIDAGGIISVSWQPVEERGGVETTVHAEGTTLVTVEDAGVKRVGSYLFRVRQGALTEVSFSLPPEIQLQRISGPDVGGWETAGEGADRRLRVLLRRSVSDETRLTLELYQALSIGDDPATLNHAAVVPLGVTRETGSVAVFAGPQLRVQGAAATGVSRINAKDFAPPAELAKPAHAPELAYQYAAQPIELQWTVSREKAEATAVAEHGVIVERRRVRYASRIAVTMTGAPRARISVALPAGYLPFEVNADGLSDWFVGPVEGSTKTLVLEFAAPRLGTTRILLDGQLAKDAADEMSVLVVPTPIGLNKLNTSLAIWIDDAYTATFNQPAGWSSARPEELSPEVQKLRPRPPQFALRSQETSPGPVTLDLSRVTPRLIADTLSLVTVTETAVHYTLALKWRIAQGAADTFVFVTPDWLGGRLEFAEAGLRQVSQSSLPNGRVRWVVTLEDPVREQFFLTALAILPAPTENEILAPAVAQEEPVPDEVGAFRPLATQRQFVVLVNQSDSQLTSAAPGSSEAVDPKDLPIRILPDLITQAAEVLAVRGADQAPRWRRQRLSRQGGAPASVNLADLLTVVERDGSWRTRMTYRIKNRARQFLPLRLPADTRLLSVFVANQPARPVTTTRNGQPLYLIALPKTSDAALSFTVEAVIAGRLPGGPLARKLQIARRELQLPAPDVVSLQDDPDFGIPVARTRWTVYLPPDQDVEVIDDPARTNLSELTSGAERLLDLDATLSEASTLLGVLKGANSARARYEAYGNLKKLEIDVHNFNRDYSVNGNLNFGDQLGLQLQERQSQILSDIKTNESLLRIDSANRTAVSNQSGANEGFFDESVQRQQAQDISRSNTITAPSEGEAGFGVFRFGSLEARSEEGRKAPEKSSPGQEGSDQQSAKKTLGERRMKGSQQFELNRELEVQLEENRPAAKPEDAPRDAVQQQQPRAGSTPQAMDKDKGGNGSAGRMGGSQRMRNMARQDAPAAVPSDQIDTDVDGLRRRSLFGGGGLTAGEEAITPGGLSLAVDLPIPENAQKLVFSKPGGTPRLTMSTRSRASLQTSLGWLWTLVWLLLGAGLVAAFAGAQPRPEIRRYLPGIVAAIGLVAFLLLPAPLSWIGLAVFAIAIAFVFRPARAAA